MAPLPAGDRGRGYSQLGGAQAVASRPRGACRAAAAAAVISCVLLVAYARSDGGSGAGVVLCVGDSLTAGWWREPGSKGALSFDPYAPALARGLGVRAVDLGWPGWKAGELVAAAAVESERAGDGRKMPGLSLAIARWAPRFVVIMAGTNDVLKTQASGEKIAADVWRLHELAHAQGVRSVVVGIPDWGRLKFREPPPEEAARRITARHELNVELQRLAKLNKMAVYVEFPMAYEDKTGFWAEDGLHFTRRGSEEVGIRLALELQSHLPFLYGESEGKKAKP